MALASSSFFLILINGAPSPTFSPTQGIQQGDSLSPFLFVLIVEGLGHSFKATIATRYFRHLSIHSIQPTLFHN